MFDHFAMLLIIVEDVPKPQSFEKSSVVIISPPWFLLRKLGFNFLADLSIFCKVRLRSFWFFIISNFSISNSHSNHQLLS